jgi:hypothetical protein
MKNLCVFYKFADRWVGKKIKWIVCKECQKKLGKEIARLPKSHYLGVCWKPLS